MVAEYRGRTRREYIKRNGEPGVAHHLVLELPTGESGALFVGQEVYEAAHALEKGDEVALEVDANVYRGEISLRVVGIAAS
jgi:hypothetical protein